MREPPPHGGTPQRAVMRSRPPRRRTDPRLPVVGGRLLEGLVESEFDFGVFEGALSPHAHGALLVHAEHQIGLGPIAHLSGCEPNTCRENQSYECMLNTKTKIQ